jgi:hypothetical protein
MVIVRSSDTLAALRDVSRLQNSVEQLPTTLSTQIVPTVEINPLLVKPSEPLGFNTSSTTGSMVIFTSGVGYITYLTSLSFSFIKDATCDIADGKIDVSTTVDGKLSNIGTLAVFTLTAQSGSMQLVFPHPLRIDPGASVSVGGSFSVGKLQRSANAQGFTINNKS